VRKIARLSLVIFLLAIGAVLSGIVSFNAGFIRGPIEAAVYEATGLPLSIGDRIIVRLGPRPGITSGNIVFGDPAGNPLLTVDSLHARVGLVALLHGDVRIHELNAKGLLIDYCSSLPVLSDDSDEDTAATSVAVDALQLERITIGCGPPSQTDPLRIDIIQATGSAPEDAPIQLDATGSVSTTDFTLTASGGELGQLLSEADQFPVQASLTSALATLDFSGHLHSLLTEPAVDARLAVHVSSMQSLSERFGLSLPAIGALHAEGQVRSDFEAVELIEFSGNLGASQFMFDAIVDAGRLPVHVGLTAALQQLDLGPFVDDGSASEQSTHASELDDVDLGTAIDMLGGIDADLLLTASSVLGVPFDLDAVEIKAAVTNGNVKLHSMAANIFGGSLLVAGSFDSATECPEINLEARGRDFEPVTLSELLGGYIDVVNLDISSCGRTLFAHRDSLHAKAELLGGRLSLGDNPLALDAIVTVGSMQSLPSPGTWPIELDARVAGSKIQLKGQAEIVAGQPVLDATVEFEAPRIGLLHPWTSVAADAELPLHMTTQLHFDESKLVANAIALSFGQSDLSGDVAWNHAADPDTLAVTLRSSYVDLDEINTVFPEEIEQPDQATTGAADKGSRPMPAAITLPPVDLDLSIDSVQAHRINLQGVDISGRLRKGLIDDARVSVRVEDEVLLRGVLDLDLRPSPATASLDVAAENVDIGLLMTKMDMADDLQLRADGVELLVNTEGRTLAQLLVNTALEARIRGFYWRIAEDSWNPEAETDRVFDLSLAQLSLTTAPNQPSTWTSSGELDGVPVELWIQTPSLPDTFGDTSDLPFTLVAAADTDIVMLEAHVDRSADELVAAHFLLSGEVLESKSRSLAQLVSPLADYSIGSEIVLTNDQLELADIQMRLGSSEASGSLKVTKDGPRRRVNIALHAPHLQTDDLLYWSRDAQAALTNDMVATATDDTDSGDEAKSNRGVFYVAKDFIAEFRESNDLDISITVDELHAGTDLLGGAEMRLFVDENDFNLKPLNISLPGGGVHAEYTASINDGRLDADLKVNADALVYGGLLRLADPDSDARGILYLDADISANTEWSPGAVPFNLLFANANGSVSFAAWPENIEAGVLDLWSANLVLALLPHTEGENESRLNCIATRFDFDNGVMSSRGPLLDSTDTIIRGRGTIDFATEELDLLVWPQAKREKFLSASTPVKVTGTFEDFQIGVAPAGFIGTIIKWYTSLIYVPYKWITGERFPPDGTATCFDTMDWELTPELDAYFLQRDFSAPPPLPQ